ncbi:protein transport protein Sec31A isoform X2 [Boleophthalmus pectinirostris]|uniref:protein transport protein Sec31A isoform X2 n=1 Tax=Boleophthalmus pectinirostris TaxID=150288 RepID=UPI00242D24EE|nr:protein transport protein Sec31A isoform X2 [Boleophthalmus pectinirostris]
MKVKEINRTAMLSWSPAQHHPIYLATGTSAQQLDASFSTSASLELFEFNLADPSLAMKSCGTLSSSHRYHKLVWSPFGIDGQGLASGVLIAGGENGNVILYDPVKIMSGDTNVIIAESDIHTGPVRALDLNPFQTNLVASGGNESEIYIWDINNFGSPMTPGPKTQPLEDISCVAWNRQVQHILASTSPSGRTSVWDLRKNDLIIKVSDHSNRMHCSGMAWNPEVATQLVMSSEDDRMPVIQMWDLRFASSPLKILENHTRGVLAIAWSYADPELLLSCGKDGRILCWNPNTAEILYELPTGNHWCFDIQWCPRNPAVLSAASFNSCINIYSIMGGTSQAQSHVDEVSHSFGTMDPFGTGQTLPLLELPQSGTISTTVNPIKKPPKWIQRPVGASFAFGGKLVSLENGKPNPQLPNRHVVHVSQVVTETDLLKRSSQLQDTISSGQFVEFCQGKINMAENDFEKTIWSFLKANFDSDTRSRFLELLGYNREELALKISAALTEKPTEMDLPPLCDAQPVADLNIVTATENPEAAFDLIAAANLKPSVTQEMDYIPLTESEETIEVNAEEKSADHNYEIVDQVASGIPEQQWDDEEILLDEEVNDVLDASEDLLQASMEETTQETLSAVQAPSEEPSQDLFSDIQAPTEEPSQDPFSIIQAPTEEPSQDPFSIIQAPTEEPLQDLFSDIQAPTEEPSQDPFSIIHAPIEEPSQDPFSIIQAPIEKPLQELFSDIQAPTEEPSQDPFSIIQAPTEEPSQDLSSDIQAPTEEPSQDLSSDIQAPTEEPSQDPFSIIQAPTEEPSQDLFSDIQSPSEEPFQDLSSDIQVSSEEPSQDLFSYIQPPSEQPPDPFSNIQAPSEELSQDPFSNIQAPSEEPSQDPFFNIQAPSEEPSQDPFFNIQAPSEEPSQDPFSNIQAPSEEPSQDLFSDIQAPSEELSQDHIEKAFQASSELLLTGEVLKAPEDGALQVIAPVVNPNLGINRDVDRLITQALLTGDFEGAVELCLLDNRMADSIILAIAGGAELLEKTQKKYFIKSQSKLTKLISAVVMKDLHDILSTCDLQNWKEAMAAVMTYAQTQEFSSLCDLLGGRLEGANDPNLQAQACLCYICAGNLEKLVSCWIKAQEGNNPLSLQDLVEKVVVMRHAVEQMQNMGPLTVGVLLAKKMGEYANLLASQGCLTTAITYLPNETNHVCIQLLRERLSHALGQQDPASFKTQSAPSQVPPLQTLTAGQSNNAYSVVQPTTTAPAHLQYYQPVRAASTVTSWSNQTPTVFPHVPPSLPVGTASDPSKVTPSSPMCTMPTTGTAAALSASSAPFIHSHQYQRPQNGWNDPPTLSRGPKKKIVPENYTPPAPITTPIMAPLGANLQPQQMPSGSPQLMGQIPHAVQTPYSGMQQPLVPSALNSMNTTMPKTSSEGAPGAPIGDVIQPPRSMPAEKITKKPIPDEHFVLKTTFEGLIQKCLIVATDPQTKRKLDDANKRLETLYDKLREHTLSPAIIGGLHNIARTIESRSYTEGLNIHTHIVSSSNFSEISGFMPVLKVVLTQANKLGV